jgi:hypothetical protein
MRKLFTYTLFLSLALITSPYIAFTAPTAYYCKNPEIISSGQFSMGFQYFVDGFRLEMNLIKPTFSWKKRTYQLTPIRSKQGLGYSVAFKGPSDPLGQLDLYVRNEQASQAYIQIFARHTFLVDADYYGWSEATANYKCFRI